MDINGLLNNPLLAAGAGMLDPRETYGSFGAALSRGLLSGQAMRQSNLDSEAKKQLNEMRVKMMEEAELKRKFEEQQQKAYANMIGVPGAIPQQSPAQQPAPFGAMPPPPVNAPIPGMNQGILGEVQKPTGMMAGQMPTPAQLYGLLQPQEGAKAMLSQMQPPDPTTAFQKYKEQIALGVPQEVALGNAFGHPPATNITVGGVAPPRLPLTPEQNVQYGLPPSAKAVFDDKGIPKVVSEGDAEKRKEWMKLSSAGSAVDRYKNLLEKYGTEQWPGADKLSLGSAYAEVLFQAKELANLGVLQGQDLALMERVLIDPTSFKNMAYSGKDALKQLEQFEQKLDDAWATAIQMYGLPPGSQEIK